MKKIIYRIFIALSVLIFGSIVYLGTIGIKTDKFNSKISDQIKKINKNLDIKIKKVSIILNLVEFEINAKTLETDLIYRDKTIQLDSIKSNFSIKSLIDGQFALTGLNISTKSSDIKNLTTFIRLFKNDPKFYIAEKLIKNGHVIADVEMEFDNLGNIKNNFKIKGLVKDGQISFLKKYNLDKIDFIFNIQEKNFQFNDLRLSLNDKDVLIPQINIKKKNNEYLVSGKINNENTLIDRDYIKNFTEIEVLGLDFKEIIFNSENNFKFRLNKNFKISDLDINSEINLNNLKLRNNFKLKKIFPNIKKEIFLQNHLIKINYSKDKLNITGSGQLLIQDDYDKIEYNILKDKNEIKYETNLIIKKNSLIFDLLNYEKNKKSDLQLHIKAKTNKKNIIFEEISLKEKKNIILIKGLFLSNNYKIDDIGNINVDYIDRENLKNKIQIIKNDNNYLVKGNSFNLNKVVDSLLSSDNNKRSELFNNNFKLNFDIKKIYLDKVNSVNNFKGNLFLKDNKVHELILEANFSNQKNIKLTIKTKGSEQITTLFSGNAKPLIDRYKFIKGFNEGALDFYSSKKNNNTISKLKIYDFKLKELPALTNLLTLASLQGIADLLSGEGIRFNEFEMNFSNEGDLMTIDEIFAIGPAISILMDGYIEKNKLISLRGTLVPATTINKTIGSIPILGNILVGKKTGDGVFGVSFKVKGQPNVLDTTVNPIKTLTPRFITRTLEKIKKN